MLHGLGLVEPFDSQIIVAHMADAVDPADDPEGALLNRGTGVDISGRGVDALPAPLRAEILDRWPRLTLAAVFGACFRDQAARKPESAAALAIRSGLPDRMAANPLER